MFQKTPQVRVLFRCCRRQVQFVVLGVLLFALGVASVATVVRPHTTTAATNNYLNFQARLQTAAGAVVPDGYYNIEFRLYDAASSGTLLWSEAWYDSNGATAGNDNRVQVKNGYFSASLGSITSFPSTINWDQQLWMTMRVGGSAQTSSPSYDSEMSPRLKVTGVPYAFRAGELAKYNSSTGYSGVLQFQNTTGGNQTFQIPDQGAAGTYTLMTRESLSASAIQNTTTLQTSANLAIQSAGDSSVTALLKARSAQSADILKITDGSNSLLFNISGAGTLRATQTAQLDSYVAINGTPSSSAQLSVKAAGASTVGLSILSNGNTTQTADLLNIDGDGTKAMQYTAAGTLALTAGSGQTGDLLSLSDTNASVVAKITASGGLQAASYDTASAGALDIGTTNATSIGLKKNTTVTGTFTQSGGAFSLTGSSGTSSLSATSTTLNITAGAFSTWQTTSGGLLINAGGNSETLGITTGSGGTIEIGRANTATISIGSTNNARTINVGAAGSSTVQTVTVGSTGGASITTIQGGSAGVTISSGDGIRLNGATTTLVKPTSNTTTAFQIQPAASTTPVINADTSNSRVGINTASPGYALDVAGSANVSSGNTYKINGTDICTGSGCTAASGSSYYIQNNTSGFGQSANIYITSGVSNQAVARFQSPFGGTGDLIQLANGVGTIMMNLDSNGVFTHKPTNTATSVFRIQDTSSVNMFDVDISNKRVIIGPLAGDTTGTLLTLGKKTNAGDPSGVYGAMYYSTSMQMYRCFRAGNGTESQGAWEPCGLNPIDRGFVVEDEFMSGVTTATAGTTGIGDKSWTVLGSTGGGGCTNTVYNGGTYAPTADRPGIMVINTNNTSASGCIMGMRTADGDAMVLSAGTVAKEAITLGATTNTVFRSGLTNIGGVGGTGSAGTGVWWEADTDVNANWRYCYTNGAGTVTCANSGTAIAAGTFASLEIRVTGLGTNTSSVEYFINGTRYTVSGVTVNTTNRVSPTMQCFTTANAAKACVVDYWQVRSYASAQR